MHSALSFDTLENIYQTTRHHIPHDSKLRSHLSTAAKTGPMNLKTFHCALRQDLMFEQETSSNESRFLPDRHDTDPWKINTLSIFLGLRQYTKEVRFRYTEATLHASCC
jgi:hypothetical protein